MAVAGSPPASGASQEIRYDWTRFWISQTGILDLSDAGFLRDPVDSLYGAGALRTLAELEAYPALALLGEPGIGKSATLRREHERVSALPAERNIVSMYVDLNGTSSQDWLYRRTFESIEVAAWKEGDARLCLFLDSLDEAMLRIETVAHILAEGIKTFPTDRLSVRVACRTAVWPAATLGRTLTGIWGDSGFGVFELAPLRRRDVLTALAANGIDCEEFVAKLFGAQAVAFAIKPLTLKMLIRLYKRDGRLPTSTGDLYRQGCLALCEESSDSRRETGRPGHLNGRQRLRIAGRIAVATMLGHRFAVWNGPEIEAPNEDVAVAAVSGAREEADFPTFTTTDDDVREVLDTGLFSARGDRRMGWAHQTYGEFLAANYLVEKGVPPQTIHKALTHPHGGLIPPLSIVGAWAASLSPELRASLIATDPWTLLRGDLSKWAATDLAALVDSLLAYVEQGRFHEYFLGVFQTYERLKHSGLAAQLHATITDRALQPITRRTALSIAERCELKELQPELLEAARDRAEDPMVRAGAVAALKQCGDPFIPAQILAMTESGVGFDPQAEIRGHVLDLLWPVHINADQLFGLLAPSDEHYVGSYALFIFGLPATLTPEHLRPALAWATTYINSSNVMGEFRDKTLADAIMFRAWARFEDPALTGPFLAHVAARLHQHGELCRGTDVNAKKAFAEGLRTDTSRRRQFVLRLCHQHMDRLAALPYVRAGFVTIEDFEWLLEISPGGSSQLPVLSEESLCSFVGILFNQENNDQFEALYPVCQNWPLLRRHFAFLIDGVMIESADAVQARAIHRQMQEMWERAPVPAIADLPTEIAARLGDAENGEWRAWCWLNLILMLTPKSPVIVEGLRFAITTMPGWASADEATRRRIVATARTYLTDAESSADSWLGKNPMTVRSNDVSAVRAFILLLQESPDDFVAIPQAAWEKWTPVIVGLRLRIADDASGETRRLVRDALVKAPATFVSAVRKMLHMEKAEARAQSDAQTLSVEHPFLFLRDLEDCWDDEALKAALFGEMQASDLRPAEYAALMDALLAARYEPAIADALARIDLFDENTTVIADAMLRHAAGVVWPFLWPKLIASDALARAVLARAAGSFYHSPAFFAGMGAEDIADLYLLMARLFPPAEDPGPASGFVTPLQMVTSLRDGGVRYIAEMGTEQAVRALMRLVAERPDIQLLPFELSRGELAMRLKTWSPLSTREVLALTDRPSARLITSAADLLEVLSDSLARYAAGLHGAQTPVRDLWDRQGSTQTYRPIDENGFSDVIARFLRQELRGCL